MANLIYNIWKFSGAVAGAVTSGHKQIEVDARIAADRLKKAKSNLAIRRCPSDHHGQLPPLTSPFTQERYNKGHTRTRLEEKQAMLADGWCRHQVDYLVSYYPESFSYFAALGRSPFRLESHTPCATKPSCVAYNTDIATYRTRHISADCTCPTVYVPYRDLIDTIKDRYVPLLSIDREENSELQLHVHSRTATSSYIAISHVWADGLGNPHENGLPRCQIQRLKAYLEQMIEGNGGKPMCLWMDTLCIPVKTEDMGLRLTQIDKMSSIYKGAAFTLVLDHELMQTEHHVSPLRDDQDQSRMWLSAETRARIACSVWMRRSWTLQEGQLPPNIAIKFKNDIIAMGRRSLEDGGYHERSLTTTGLLDTTEAAKPKDSSDPTCDCVDIALEKSFYLTFCDDSLDFVSAWNSLAGRSTTQPRDVPFIMTNILDLENTPIMEYHEANQMFHTIIMSLPSPPLSIFFNEGPRHDAEGNHTNRWVPREIGKDMLSPVSERDGTLSVHDTHITLTNYSATSAYWVDTVVPLKSEVRLSGGADSGATISYEIAASMSEIDRLETALFATTIFVFESSSGTSPRGRRGACFYARDKRDPNTLSEIDLVYVCPVIAKETARGAEQSSASRPEVQEIKTYFIRPITSRPRCELKIQHEPPPSFRPLTQRTVPSINTEIKEEPVITIAVVLIIASIVLILVFVPKILIRRKRYSGIGAWILSIFIAFVAYVVIGVTAELIRFIGTKYLVRRTKWRYVQSFEAIAARQISKVGMSWRCMLMLGAAAGQLVTGPRNCKCFH